MTDRDDIPVGKHGPYGTHTNPDGSPATITLGTCGKCQHYHGSWLPCPTTRRPDVLALEAACEQCHRCITSPTTGIISGDCLFCGGRMVATKGAWTMTNFPEKG